MQPTTITYTKFLKEGFPSVIHTTGFCNNDCIFCPGLFNNSSRHIDIEIINKQMIADKKRGANKVMLSGGEPTTHPGIVDIIKLARVSGYKKIDMVTNARLLSNIVFFNKLVDAGLNFINITFNSINKQINEKLSGRNSFIEQKQAIENALTMSNLDISINTVITSYSLTTLPNTVQYLSERGIKNIAFKMFIPPHSIDKNVRIKLLPDMRASVKIIEKLVIKYLNVIRFSIQDIPPCVFSRSVLDNCMIINYSIHDRCPIKISKRDVCVGCKLNNKCSGIFDEYWAQDKTIFKTIK